MVRVSVVVTSFNGERFLGQQLRSILDQSRPADEIVLGDDASTDTSLSLARDILAPFSGDLCILASPTRLGIRANLTRCLEHSTGDVVVFADQDDVWLPHKLATIASALSQSPATDLVFSDGRLIDESGRPLGSTLWAAVGFGERERRRWRRSPIQVLTSRTGATMAARRSLVRAGLPLPPDCWHDEWLALGAVLRGAAPLPLGATLIDYRVHGSNAAGLPSRRLRDRLVQAGWPRDTRIGTWQMACDRFGPTSASDHLQGAIALARNRPQAQASLSARAQRALSLSVGGNYHRYGQGWRMGIHDLISPALYGRN
jgi:glycosyltransferase involved in cell wall biosynthesis